MTTTNEMLVADEPATADEVRNLFVQIKTLLTPSATGSGFAKKYDTALQRDPAVVLAHADATKILATVGGTKL